MLALIEAVKAGDMDRGAGDLRTGRAGSRRLVRSGDARRRNREVFRVAVAERWRLVDQGADGTDARHRQRGVAVSRSRSCKDAQRLAIRHGRREGRSPRPPHRAQRTGGDPRSAGPTSPRSASTRSDGTRRQARRHCTRRPFAAIPAGRTACTGRRAPGSGAVRSATCCAAAADDRGAPAAPSKRLAVPRLLLPDPDRAGAGRRRRGEGLRRQRRDVAAGSRSSRGRPSTTSPAS